MAVYKAHRTQTAKAARESGHPLWDAPQYDLGLDIDFITMLSLPRDGLAQAIEEDEGVKPDPATRPLLSQDRAHVSHTVQYSGVSADGSVVMVLTLLLINRATGEVTISSADIRDPPVIDANFLGTAVDRYAMRESIRHDIELMTRNNTVVGREIVAGEANPSPLSVTSTDEEIDARIRQFTVGCFHPMGTASMGKVVDSDLRLKGVKHLRIADTSVFPVSIAANLQVATYALAEQAADIIKKAGPPGC